jgi:hypothetical protein
MVFSTINSVIKGIVFDSKCLIPPCKKGAVKMPISPLAVRGTIPNFVMGIKRPIK